MNYRLLAPAEQDLQEAVDWYEEKREALGIEFLYTVRSILWLICDLPLAYPIVHHDFHKARVPHFPYNIIYAVAGNTIEVIAVFHFSRDPIIWQRRCTH